MRSPLLRRPALAATNAANLRSGYSKASGNAVLALLCGSNFLNLISGKFRFPCSKTKRQPFCLSPFAVPVNRVVLVGAKEQVIDIHAEWRIACVADAQIIWNSAIRALPHHAVRAPVLPLPRYNPVSALGLLSRPQKASGRIRAGIMRKALHERPFTHHTLSSSVGHNLNCSSKAVAGQGWTSRVNASQPAFYSTTKAFKAIGVSR